MPQELLTPQLNVQRGAQFVPEIWLNEIQAFRKSRQIDASCCLQWAADVKKGDVFHIPRVNELGVEDKALDTGVALQNIQDTDYTISVDTDRVSAIGIDIMLDAHSSYDVRKPYMMAMGYALAKDFSGSILGLRAAIYNTSASNVFASSNGLITGNGTAMTYATLLTAQRILLENDVEDGDDLSNLVLMCSPAQATSLMSINQFISSDYISGRPIPKGMICSILGIDVFRTNLIGANSLTGWKNGFLGVPEPTPGVTGSRYFPRQDVGLSLPLTFTGNSKVVHSAILCQREWAGAVVTKKPSVTTSFENREQIDLHVARQAYGAKLYRPGHAVLIHTSNDIA